MKDKEKKIKKIKIKNHQTEERKFQSPNVSIRQSLIGS